MWENRFIAGGSFTLIDHERETMKRTIKIFAALSLCAAMLTSGCSSAPADSEFAYAEDYVPVAAPAEASVVKGNGGGNIGEVRIASGDTYAVISVEGFGDIKIKLFPDKAPYAVQNFIKLAQNGNYNDRTFHRIMDNFMIQGNSSAGTSSDGGVFRNEINTDMRHFYGALCCASNMGYNSDQFYIVNNKTEQAELLSQYMYFASVFASNANKCEEYMNSDEYKDNPNAVAYYMGNKIFYSESSAGAEAMLQTLTDDVSKKYLNGGVCSLDGQYTVFGQTVEGFDVLDKISKVEVTANPGNPNETSYPVKDVVIKSVKIYTAK